MRATLSAGEYGDTEFMRDYCGKASATLGKPVSEQEMDRLGGRINEIASTLEQVRVALGTKADEIFGGDKLEGPNAKAVPRPVRSGRIGELHDALDNLDTLACDARGEAQRFTRL